VYWRPCIQSTIILCRHPIPPHLQLSPGKWPTSVVETLPPSHLPPTRTDIATFSSCHPRFLLMLCFYLLETPWSTQFDAHTRARIKTTGGRRKIVYLWATYVLFKSMCDVCNVSLHNCQDATRTPLPSTYIQILVAGYSYFSFFLVGLPHFWSGCCSRANTASAISLLSKQENFHKHQHHHTSHEISKSSYIQAVDLPLYLIALLTPRVYWFHIHHLILKYKSVYCIVYRLRFSIGLDIYLKR